MRKITIFCSAIVALALVAAPARADPTTNTVFAVFDFGGFDTEGTSTDDFDFQSTSNLLFVNLIVLEGEILDFGGLSFNQFSFDGDLSEVPYFLLGHILGSDHLVVSADEPAMPLPGTFDEAAAIAGVMDIGGLHPDLPNGGGSAFVGPGQFMGHFGAPIGTFTQGGLGFDTVANVGDTGGVDINGFTDPVFLATVSIDFVNGQIVGTQVPEPGLALLAITGIAGALIARRRRRAS